jgi:hypothetical protein
MPLASPSATVAGQRNWVGAVFGQPLRVGGHPGVHIQLLPVAILDDEGHSDVASDRPNGSCRLVIRAGRALPFRLNRCFAQLEPQAFGGVREGVRQFVVL